MINRPAEVSFFTKHKKPLVGGVLAILIALNIPIFLKRNLPQKPINRTAQGLVIDDPAKEMPPAKTESTTTEKPPDPPANSMLHMADELANRTLLSQSNNTDLGPAEPSSSIPQVDEIQKMSIAAESDNGQTFPVGPTLPCVPSIDPELFSSLDGPLIVQAMDELIRRCRLESYTHTVRTGDSLYLISQTLFGSHHLWSQIWARNPKISQPHNLENGFEIQLTQPERRPASDQNIHYYIVQKKRGRVETLPEIAKRFGNESLWESILKQNPSVKNPYSLKPGQLLRLDMELQLK